MAARNSPIWVSTSVTRAASRARSSASTGSKEFVEIGGQSKLAGMVALAAAISGDGLAQQFVRDGERLRGPSG